MKKRILFVDDEPSVLDGLQRMLRPLRNEWDMAFARSGAEALTKMAEAPFDVIVSDMRMPEMDGAQLLTEVMRRYPQTVRIVLSGHSNKEMILRSAGPAHQYLAKPCDAETLRTTVARACALRELLNSDALRGLVSRIATLPSLPEIYVEIVRELQSPDASIQKVGQIIEKDIAMTAKILQLVNSAFFGLPRHVSHPALAVSLLGLDTVKALALSVHLLSCFDQKQAGRLNLTVLWNHSVATGTLARQIARETQCDAKSADHALMAGCSTTRASSCWPRTSPSSTPWRSSGPTMAPCPSGRRSARCWARRTQRWAPICWACEACRIRSWKQSPTITPRRSASRRASVR